MSRRYRFSSGYPIELRRGYGYDDWFPDHEKQQKEQQESKKRNIEEKDNKPIDPFYSNKPNQYKMVLFQNMPTPPKQICVKQTAQMELEKGKVPENNDKAKEKEVEKEKNKTSQQRTEEKWSRMSMDSFFEETEKDVEIYNRICLEEIKLRRLMNKFKAKGKPLNKEQTINQ